MSEKTGIETVSELAEQRNLACVFYCRLVEFDQRAWKEVDRFVGQACGYSQRSFRDIRTGRKNLSNEGLSKLLESLGEKGEFKETRQTLSILTKQGRTQEKE